MDKWIYGYLGGCKSNILHCLLHINTTPFPNNKNRIIGITM